jgi:hypothetical protein
MVAANIGRTCFNTKALPKIDNAFIIYYDCTDDSNHAVLFKIAQAALPMMRSTSCITFSGVKGFLI